MFQTRLIFEENDKEEYFNFFSQTNIDIFYRFANKAAGIVFQCQCEKGEKKRSDYVTLGIWIWLKHRET